MGEKKGNEGQKERKGQIGLKSKRVSWHTFTFSSLELAVQMVQGQEQ